MEGERGGELWKGGRYNMYCTVREIEQLPNGTGGIVLVREPMIYIEIGTLDEIRVIWQRL